MLKWLKAAPAHSNMIECVRKELFGQLQSSLHRVDLAGTAGVYVGLAFLALIRDNAMLMCSGALIICRN
jgi:hypothetical protein